MQRLHYFSIYSANDQLLEEIFAGGRGKLPASEIRKCFPTGMALWLLRSGWAGVAPPAQQGGGWELSVQVPCVHYSNASFC